MEEQCFFIKGATYAASDPQLQVALARIYAGDTFVGLGDVTLREGRPELKIRLYLTVGAGE